MGVLLFLTGIGGGMMRESNDNGNSRFTARDSLMASSTERLVWKFRITNMVVDTSLSVRLLLLLRIPDTRRGKAELPMHWLYDIRYTNSMLPTTGPS
jgi:hypothetical protein